MVEFLLVSPPVHTTSDSPNGDGFIPWLVVMILFVIVLLITVMIAVSRKNKNQTRSEKIPNSAPVQPSENDNAQQAQSSDNVKPQKRLSSFRVFLKIILLAALIAFALVNYRIFTFDKGLSQTDIGNKDVSDVITSLVSIRKIEYYKRTIPNGDYSYKIFIETANDNYLLEATQQDVTAIQALGFLSGSSKVNKITPVPFYVEVIIGFLVLLIPIHKKISD